MPNPAKAAVIAVDLDKEDVMLGAVFTDDGEGMDPLKKCEYFWESVKDDWPTYQPVYAANDEAGELATQRRLWSLGLADDSEMAPRIEQHNREVAERKADAK